MNLYLNNEKIAEAKNITFTHPNEAQIKNLIAQSLAAVGKYSEANVEIHYKEFLSLINSNPNQKVSSDEILPIDNKTRKKMLWKNRIKGIMKP